MNLFTNSLIMYSLINFINLEVFQEFSQGIFTETYLVVSAGISPGISFQKIIKEFYSRIAFGIFLKNPHNTFICIKGFPRSFSKYFSMKLFESFSCDSSKKSLGHLQVFLWGFIPRYFLRFLRRDCSEIILSGTFSKIPGRIAFEIPSIIQSKIFPMTSSKF